MVPDFPKFGPLPLESKADYERLISEFPPFSDISFATLHIWWNLEGQLAISLLNENLVINFELASDDVNSGWCIIGKNKIDESIDTIFNYLAQNSKTVKLVHVPEFVVEKINDRSVLNLEEETDYNEYILDSNALSKLEGSIHGKNRRRINKFLREVEGQKVEIKELDLSSQQVKNELMDAIVLWEEEKAGENDPDHNERDAIKKALDHSKELGMLQAGLYINDNLQAIILYHQPHDKNYYILNHIKVDYSTPYIFDYITHHVANKAAQEGVQYLNMEMDLGIEGLREHKMGLRPVNFFKKYTITPVKK